MKKTWKFYLGIALFTYSWIPYIFVFLIMPFLSFTTTEALSISSVILVTAEVAFAISIALLGKDFINMLKAKFKSKFSKKGGKESFKPISKLRYRIGIILFIFTLAIPSILTEVVLYYDYLDYIGLNNLLYIYLSFDVIFISSLFILGGEFIDKLRGLFTYADVVGKGTK
jgi:hypothetical protein